MALKSRGGWSIRRATLIGFLIGAPIQIWGLSRDPEVLEEMAYLAPTLPVYVASYFVARFGVGAVAGGGIAALQNLFVRLFGKPVRANEIH
jgi:hypothetical protein